MGLKHRCIPTCVPPVHACFYFEPKGTGRTGREILNQAKPRTVEHGIWAQDARRAPGWDLAPTWDAWLILGELLKDVEIVTMAGVVCDTGEICS